MAESKIRFSDAIICDLVRKEDNGKAILIGVYNQDIIVNKFPARLRLSVYLSGIIQTTPNETTNFDIRFRLDSDVLAIAETVVGPTKSEDSFVLAMQLPLEIPGEGELTLQTRHDGGRWRTLKRLRVKAKIPD